MRGIRISMCCVFVGYYGKAAMFSLKKAVRLPELEDYRTYLYKLVLLPPAMIYAIGRAFK